MVPARRVSPGPLLCVRDVVAVRRRETQPYTGIDELGMRIVATMKLSNGFGIDVAGLRLDQRALLEMRLEQALRADEKRRAIVAMPSRVAAGHDLGAEDEHLGLRIPRK